MCNLGGLGVLGLRCAMMRFCGFQESGMRTIGGRAALGILSVERGPSEGFRKVGCATLGGWK